ncbi:Ribonucleoside-diphosphate reductase large subunit [Hordeum vulgare]|nr:Ribonucleoside-diphosphate reductase large subunit [Hordeum vulgare]
MDDLSSRVEMAESNTAVGKMANGEASDDNGRAIEVVGGEDTLPVVLHNFVDGVWPPPGNGGDPLLQRLRVASCEAAPRLGDASRNSACDLLPWTKQGSGLRSILVISFSVMYVVKWDGWTETVHFNKITARLKKLSYGLSQEHCDPVLVAQKVCAGVYMGVTTSQLDELAAETAATLRASQPDYASIHSLFRFVSPLPLAARIDVSNLLPSGNSVCGARK